MTVLTCQNGYKTAIVGLFDKNKYALYNKVSIKHCNETQQKNCNRQKFWGKNRFEKMREKIGLITSAMQ